MSFPIWLVLLTNVNQISDVLFVCQHRDDSFPAEREKRNKQTRCVF